MKSNYFLTFTAILLMNTCVVETLGFLETSSYTSELKSKDGQLNHLREKRASTSYTLEYIVVVEINVSEVILIQQLQAIGLGSIIQLDNTTKISTVNVTTVCQLNSNGYQCRCENQYFWPCDKCIQYGQCNGTNKCNCINGVPNDGQFCQPQTGISSENTCPTSPPSTETTKYMSLSLDEKFDIALSDKNSVKYNKYKATIEGAIDKSYRHITGYIPGSVVVLGFRPGSVIVDFTINASTNTLDFKFGNSALSQTLTADGFKVNNNPIAFSEEYNLTQNTGIIYPLQDIQLNCALPTDGLGGIQWQVNGAQSLKPNKYNILNNNRTLIVKNVSATDSGIYQCITEVNSLTNIQWQRIAIQPFPNIQVDPDKVYKCENLSIPLKCCAQSSYTIEWTEDSLSPLTPPGPGTNCIVYTYTVWQKDCAATDKIVTLTCRLSDTSLSGFSYSSSNIKLNIIPRAFNCNDVNFGAGTVNQTAYRQCDGANIGIQWAVCNKTGQWSIISNNCTLRVLQNLADMAENLDIEAVPMFATDLLNAVENNTMNISTVPVNLLKVVDLLSTIAKFSKANSFAVDQNTMKDFLKTVDVITSETAQETWNSFNSENTNMNAISMLLQSIESIGSSLSSDSFSITTSNIQLERNFSNSTKLFNTNSTTQASIAETSGRFLVTVIVFSALNSVLPGRDAAYNNSSKTQSSINGDLVVIEGDSTINNVSLFFEVKNRSLGNPQCVFWNFSLLNGIGAWDSTGCEIKQVINQDGKLTCECSHTTSFSILMSPFSPDNQALAYITYIGVGISIGSLVLCLIIEGLIWKSMSKNDTSYMRHISTINIALSLLVADICFIIGAAIGTKGQKTPEGPCSTVTFFIHFFYLALFFWMLLSALLLLYRIVVVFSRLSRTVMMTIAFSVGYGAPLIIAVITVAATSGNRGYIQEENTCWLNWYKTKAILAFVIPALTIVFINLLVLIILVYKILKSGISATIQRDEKDALVVITRCVVILTPFFGLTWGFGIGTIVSPDFGIHVVFAILNSLQGFFILVLGTLLDKKIIGVLLGRWRQRNMSSTQSGNIVGGKPSSNRRGYYHVFPRRYGYNISTAAYSSNVPSSNTETFKFTDK
ncbi:adhesion G protein-coupled receptor F5-like isoform X2 [Tachysurus fulvidraco]|nr:adhesion G protein-coupled receptor F5-like isoform X2 [Tachysurus fulvidraco]